MSRVIKSRRLVVSAPVELGKVRVELTQVISPERQDDSADILEETEEIVKELLRKAELKATEILDSAHKEAKKIREQTLFETEKAKELAFEEGYRQGLNLAQKETDGTRQEILATAYQELEEATLKKNNYLRQVKEDIIELAVKMAEKLITQQLTMHQDSIYKTVNEVLAEAIPDNQTQVVIKVSPECKEALNEAITANLVSWPADKIVIETDPQLTDGSCIIITTRGTYHLLIDEALTKLKHILIGADLYE